MPAGDYWFDALSNVGKNIGAGIKEYRQRHDELDQVDSTVKMFSQFGVGENGQLTRAGKFTDESGKPYAVQPIIPPEMLAEWSQFSSGEKMKNIGAMESLLKFQQLTAATAAKARLTHEQQAAKEQAILDRQEDLATFKSTLSGGKETTAEKEEGKILGQEKAHTDLLNDAILNGSTELGRFATADEVRKGLVPAPAKGEQAFVPHELDKNRPRRVGLRTVVTPRRPHPPHPDVIKVTSPSGQTYFLKKSEYEKRLEQINNRGKTGSLPTTSNRQSTSTMPQRGDRRYINGRLGEWNGKHWVAVQEAAATSEDTSDEETDQ